MKTVRAEAIRLCAGLSFVELDEIGLAPALFDELGGKAYQPVVLEAAEDVHPQKVTRFVLGAVPTGGGVSAAEARVHNDLYRCVVDLFGSNQAYISSANFTKSGVPASEVEVEIIGEGLDRLGTTGDVFGSALQRRMAGKWSGLGCALLVSIVGKTHLMVVHDIRVEGEERTPAPTSTATSTCPAPPRLFAFTRETRWHVVPGRSCTYKPTATLPEGQPLPETERQIRTLLELEMRRKSARSQGKNVINASVGSGVLLTGVAGVGKWTAVQRIATVMGAEIIEINLASNRTNLRSLLDSSLQRVQSADRRHSAKSLVVLRQLEIFAAPPADEDSSYKWMGPPGSSSSSSSGDKMGAASRVLDFVDSLSSLPGVAVVGLLRQGYALPSSFLRPPRFDHTFVLPAPSAPSRRQILQTFLGQHHLHDTDLQYLAEATQGYVLRDLVRLSRRIALHAQVRLKRTGEQKTLRDKPLRLERQDIEAAMVAVRPSQMFELTVRPPRVKWEDVAGCDNARRELEEAVKWGLASEKSPLLASLAPQAGVLLYGPSGCGKTLCAHAFASALRLPFISIKGPELYSKYLGETEGLIRRLFERARQVAPSVIFFDEIDALAPTRSGDTEGMGGMGQRVLSQLLNEMDGVSARSGVLILACTSRPDLLDPALLRPGRLERLVYVGPPTLAARVQLLEMERRRKVPFAAGVMDQNFAELTDGLTPAEILACCREAALLALTEDMNAVEVRWEHVRAAVQQRRQTGGLMLTDQALLPYRKFAQKPPA